MFGLSGITIHGNSKILLNDNDKTIYLKSGEYLFSDIEQKVVEQIIVRNRYELEFQFKIGIKKTIKEL